MGIGLSGMMSGMDTDAIVKQLVAAQRTKSTKIENKITLNKWTTDAWSSMNTKIYSFYTKYASKLRLQSSYMTRKASSSNENIVKAAAASTSAVGTHSLIVKKLASSQYVTGAKLKNDTKFNRNTKLTEMGNGVKAGTIITFTGKKGTDNEKEVKLEVTADTTVNDFLNSCKAAGLSANFDETQQRFFISSSQSGADDAFSITTSALSEGASDIFNKLDEILTKNDNGNSKLSGTVKKEYENAMSVLRQNVGMLKDVLADTFVYEDADKKQKAVYDAVQKVKEIGVDLAALETAFNEVTSKDLAEIENAGPGGRFILYGEERDYDELYEKAEEKIKADYDFIAASKAFGALKDVELSEAYTDPAKMSRDKIDHAKAVYEKLTAADGPLAADGTLTLADGTTGSITDIDTLNKAVEDGTLTEEDAAALKDWNTWTFKGTDAEGNAVDVQQIYNDTYNENLNSPDHAARIRNVMYDFALEGHKEERDARVLAEKELLIADENNAELNELKALIETNFKAASDAGAVASADGLKALGLDEITGAAVAENAGNGMVVVEASNSEIVLDGSTMEETSNNFTVNGLTLDLISTSYNKETGEYDPVQITIGKDGNSCYDLVKEALTEYNKLIDEMNELYYAKPAKGYAPLTSEQKEAMAEDDIKNWEDKIKSALLRRDDSLGGLLSGMRDALGTTYVNEKGEKFNLASFGIVTGNYTERGKLHIYGDPDDPTYAAAQDRLKKALEENPEDVMEAMSHIFGNLYSTMTEKCAKTEISSALTFYNDKQYNKLLGGYEKDLAKMEDKIAAMEDRYYKQFTAMETALAKLQSQTNSLASMLGMNNQQR